MDEFELKSKLRGYYKMPRMLIIQLLERKITASQFSLLLIYIGFADRDKRHKNYATSDISNRKLSRIIGLNKDKIAQDKKILYVKGFIDIKNKKGNKQIIKILNPSEFFTEIVSKS